MWMTYNGKDLSTKKILLDFNKKSTDKAGLTIGRSGAEEEDVVDTASVSSGETNM